MRKFYLTNALKFAEWTRSNISEKNSLRTKLGDQIWYCVADATHEVFTKTNVGHIITVFCDAKNYTIVLSADIPANIRALVVAHEYYRATKGDARSAIDDFIAFELFAERRDDLRQYFVSRQAYYDDMESRAMADVNQYGAKSSFELKDAADFRQAAAHACDMAATYPDVE